MSTRILQIRAAQMEALKQAPLLEFEARLATHLRKNFTAQWEGRSRDELSEFVRQGIRKAKHYGIASRTNLRRFAEHLVGLGPDFDSEPWARPILTSSTLRENDKLDQIDSHEQFQRNRGRSDSPAQA